MRIVLDTNVVISGLLWSGAPRRLMQAALARQIELFTSETLLAELNEIAGRAKFSHRISSSHTNVPELVAYYLEIAEIITPAEIRQVVLADADDDHVIACAIAASADLIVSGDSDLLNLKHYQGIPIVGASQALSSAGIFPVEP